MSAILRCYAQRHCRIVVPDLSGVKHGVLKIEHDRVAVGIEALLGAD